MSHQIKHGRVARPLGTADLYLFALVVVLGAALGLAAQILQQTARARQAFRDELWDASTHLERVEELLAEIQRERPAPAT
ncbi:MAG TPA: hypothetical protein VMY78_09960 [Solirubrobacteraceae bacterium]|nr:hypothetical protein [Solirubrobacteraceae bacterium]